MAARDCLHCGGPIGVGRPASKFCCQVCVFRGNVNATDDADSCHLWTGRRDRFGYGAIEFTHAGKRQQRAHRVSYILAHGAIPNGLDVLHRCNVPACCRPSHLYAGTDAENVADRDRANRQARGEANGFSKLSAPRVIEIRRRYAGGEIARTIAEDLGISRRAVSDIVRRKRWGHLA